MAKFSLSEINSLQQQYWGEALVPINNTALDQAYWGQVQGIQSEELDRYWIGGASGDETNWHNAANWASSSGGTGGAGVPTELSNVYFDSNSNGYACVATAAMVCKYLNGVSGWTNDFNTAEYALTVNGYINITTTGTVTFTNSTITVFGSITITSALTAYNCGGVVWHFRRTGVYSVNKTQSGDYKKATIYAGVQLSIFIGAFTIRDDDTNGLITLEDSTAQLYITGGSVLVLANGVVTPVIDNGGKIYASTGYTFTIRSTVSGSVITTPKIDSGTNLLFNLQGATLGGTFTFEQGAEATCRQFVVEQAGIANATINFNTNNYALTLGVLNFVNNYGASTGTINANLGSSIINFVPYLGSVGNLTLTTDAGSTINLNTGTARIIYNAFGTFSLATSSLSSTITGNGTFEFKGGTYSVDTTFNSGGFTIPNVKVDNNSSTYSTNFTTALTTGRLLIEPNSIVKLKEGLTHTVSSYTAGDWNGTPGNLVTIKSITDTQQHTLSVPTGINVSYVDVRDSVASQKINAFLTNGCVNSGNTSNWVFVGGAWFLLASRNELYRSRNI